MNGSRAVAVGLGVGLLLTPVSRADLPAEPVVSEESARARLAVATAQLTAGELEAGRESLRQAAIMAEAARAPALAASIWNDLGTLQASEGLYPVARRSFGDAIAGAEEAALPDLAARAHANRARANLDAGETRGVQVDLDAAMSHVVPLADSSEKAFVLVGLARGFDRLREREPDRTDALLLRSHAALTEALRIAEEFGDVRTAAFALGYLGGLYAADGKPAEALELTRRAMARADAPAARDTQYLWLAQAGRLQRESGDIEASISSYRAAVADLEDLRPAAVDLYGPTGTAFRNERGRIHRELIGVLLERGPAGAATADARLEEAKSTLELLRADELRNYFQDDCVDAYRAKLTDPGRISASARVIYPVLLPERTVILVSGPEGTREYVSPAATGEIVAAARRMREQIVNRLNFRFLASARQLHGWLIDPIRAEIEAPGIDTLVFVPDGALLTIPMGALNDGETYLIERYAVAVTPGLELADPRPFDRADPKVFLGGVSEAVQGFSPLPHVREEVEAIHALYGGEVLLDADFTGPRMEADLAAPFSVVHVATHAEFNGRNADTFLVTFDGKLSLDAFTDSVGRFRFRETPLELLTLSACETASGDERAALGLAGLAIKAGARSVLATLWLVNDQAAARLVVAFYEELRKSGVSRAQALRRAQLALLSDRPYRHPAYWAAFLLIGNWL